MFPAAGCPSIFLTSCFGHGGGSFFVSCRARVYYVPTCPCLSVFWPQPSVGAEPGDVCGGTLLCSSQNQPSFLSKTHCPCPKGSLCWADPGSPPLRPQDHDSAEAQGSRAPPTPQNLSIWRLKGACSIPSVHRGRSRGPGRRQILRGVSQLFHATPVCLNFRPVDFPLCCAVPSTRTKHLSGCCVKRDLITVWEVCSCF